MRSLSLLLLVAGAFLVPGLCFSGHRNENATSEAQCEQFFNEVASTFQAKQPLQFADESEQQEFSALYALCAESASTCRDKVAVKVLAGVQESLAEGGYKGAKAQSKRYLKQVRNCRPEENLVSQDEKLSDEVFCANFFANIVRELRLFGDEAFLQQEEREKFSAYYSLCEEYAKSCEQKQVQHTLNSIAAGSEQGALFSLQDEIAKFDKQVLSCAEAKPLHSAKQCRK